MADEITNKTLAILMIVAIALSIGGTFFSLNRLAYLFQQPSPQAYVTNPTGQAKVNITGIASLRFAIATVDFGTGYVNTSEGNQYCSMASGNPTGAKDSVDRCVGFVQVNSSLQLENDGNNNLTLTIVSNKAAAAFIGGATPGFDYIIANNETSSCGNPSPSSWTAVPTLDTSACGSPGLGYLDNADSLDVHLNLTIPYNSNTGQQTATLTVTGTSV
jgi:hypothetical protein